MVSLEEVARGVARRFMGSAYRAYIDEPEANRKDKDAAVVYVTVEPVTDDTVGGGRNAERELLVDLAYVKEPPLKQTEYYAFLEECDRRLRPALPFGGRSILLTEITARKTDDVGHYLFRLTFTDALDLPEVPAQLMDKLQLKKIN